VSGPGALARRRGYLVVCRVIDSRLQLLYTIVPPDYNRGMMSVRRQLQLAGNRRAKAQAALARSSAEIQALLPQAIAEGLTKSEIARLAQVSRPALDKWLDG